jgi:hypothetical protein
MFKDFPELGKLAMEELRATQQSMAKNVMPALKAWIDSQPGVPRNADGSVPYFDATLKYPLSEAEKSEKARLAASTTLTDVQRERLAELNKGASTDLELRQFEFAKKISAQAAEIIKQQYQSGEAAGTPRGAADVARSAPDAAKGAPKSAKDAPDTAKGTPEAAKGAPDAAKGAPDAAKSAPDAVKGAPDAAKGSTEVAAPIDRGAVRIGGRQTGMSKLPDRVATGNTNLKETTGGGLEVGSSTGKPLDQKATMSDKDRETLREIISKDPNYTDDQKREALANLEKTKDNAELSARVKSKFETLLKSGGVGKGVGIGIVGLTAAGLIAQDKAKTAADPYIAPAIIR